MSDISIQDNLRAPKPIFSIEFFPPKSEAAAELMLQAADALKAYKPDFASITYGAGGSTRSRTLKYARQLSEDHGFEVMPHLTCVGHSRDELRGIISEFREAGLGQIMALRGDPPKGETEFKPHPNGLHYANELVELIRDIYPECTIGVAGYPEKHVEAPSPDIDLTNLKRKVDAGGHFVTTQLFFDNQLYYDFVESARQTGIEVPVLPGLLCVTNLEQTQRFCKMCGTSIPTELIDQLEAAGDNSEAVEDVGVEWAYKQALELLERGAPGIHLYILNKKNPTIKLMNKLQEAGYYKR